MGSSTSGRYFASDLEHDDAHNSIAPTMTGSALQVVAEDLRNRVENLREKLERLRKLFP